MLSGVRLEVDRRPLPLAGTDLDLTIQVAIDGGRRRPTAWRSLPAGWSTDIVRSLEPGAVDRRGRRRRGCGSPSGRSQFSRPHPPGRRVPPPAGATGDAVTLPADGLAERPAPGGAGRLERRRPADPHRGADGRRGRRAAPGGHRLLPAGRAGPRRAADACCPRASRCWCRPGPWPSSQRLLGSGGRASGRRRATAARADRPSSRSASTTPPSSWRRAADHPADRGRVPQLPPADPGRATRTGCIVGQEPLLDAVRRVKLLVRDTDHPGAAVAAARRGRADRHHPGRRPGHRGRRRQVRGHRAHRRLQPRPT